MLNLVSGDSRVCKIKRLLNSYSSNENSLNYKLSAPVRIKIIYTLTSKLLKSNCSADSAQGEVPKFASLEHVRLRNED